MKPSTWIRLVVILGCAAIGASIPARAADNGVATVELWGSFELRLDGPSTGNPFVDVTLSAVFSRKGKQIEAAGFYDGDGVYRIRFMPTEKGDWTYETRSNVPSLKGKTGRLNVGKPAQGNNGPVSVHNTFHFAYANTKPYYPIGTTAYAWAHQPDELEEQTLATLKASPFNKLRMCIFPKWYDWNRNEPILYPFEGVAPNGWDFTRFNPKFFQHLEGRIAQLRDLGIEADLILFHPYDKGHWGFDRMPTEADDRYLKYVIARLASYRNVWWSMANEFDFMKEKTDSDWDRFFQIVRDNDPYGHPRSIHNGTRLYDHTKPWVTHASIQNGSAVTDFGRAELFRDIYHKPIVFDEVKYEGDIEKRWGNLSAEEMVYRFWQGTAGGTYVGHGETYRDPKDILWWSKGGVLHGQSVPRLAFLRKVLEEGPEEGMEPIDKWQDDPAVGKAGEYYLIYFGKDRPTEWAFNLPKQRLSNGLAFQAEVLDTWDMTVTPVEGVFKVRAETPYRFVADRSIKLPGKPYMAIRLRRLAGAARWSAGDLPAFPGAEGFGANTSGGRRGKVYEVTNLNDHGLGSLRAAVEASGPRTVVFRVSGTITLDSDLEIRNPFITIAGQTAPGDGICLRKYKLGIVANDVIVRYLRVRRGDESREPDDGIGIYEAENVIVDHCSVSWTCDEAVNTWHHVRNATVQWCIVSEPLHNSIQHGHGFAMSIGGDNTSYHHNLIANAPGRNPSLAGNKSYLTTNLDFRNNVIFNWEHRVCDGKPTSCNIVNNYYKPGPSSQFADYFASIDLPRDMPLGRWYIDGNELEGQSGIVLDNWGGVRGHVEARTDMPFEVAPIRTVTAREAYEAILADAGATLPRQDSVDARIVQEVKSGKTTFGNGIVKSPKDVGGWPELKSREPDLDSDHDGIPDWWEIRYGLNPNDPADANADLNGDGYTNLEKYLNGIDPTKKIDWRKPENNVNPLHPGSLERPAK
jgi:pectate lyase